MIRTIRRVVEHLCYKDYMVTGAKLPTVLMPELLWEPSGALARRRVVCLQNCPSSSSSMFSIHAYAIHYFGNRGVAYLFNYGVSVRFLWISFLGTSQALDLLAFMFVCMSDIHICMTHTCGHMPPYVPHACLYILPIYTQIYSLDPS